MIELVMYGMIPSENTENFVDRRRRRTGSMQVEEAALRLSRCSTLVSTTGTGTWLPNR